MSHHLLTVELADPGAGEARSADLWSAGAVGIEERADSLRAAFLNRPAAEAALAALSAIPGIVAASIEVVDDSFGLDSARDLLGIELAGPFAIHPPWLAPPPDRIGLAIDPGHAFGSGSHPSTRLAASLVDAVAAPGARILDIGCGTGVLTIAAALLGATVVAIDPDPRAVTATIDNARRNGVDDRITAIEGTLESAVLDDSGRTDSVRGAFDAALVNVTIDLHESIGARLHPRPPAIVAAGVLAGPQEGRAAACYDATVTRSVVDGEWAGLLLTPRIG